MEKEQKDTNVILLLLQFRKEIIDQKTGNKVMSVKYHLDDMVSKCIGTYLKKIFKFVEVSATNSSIS